MRYDPDIAPSAPLWLSLEEARRIALVEEYHDATALPNARVHAAIHTAVENQIAMNLPSVVAAVARLQAQGLIGTTRSTLSGRCSPLTCGGCCGATSRRAIRLPSTSRSWTSSRSSAGVVTMVDRDVPANVRWS